MKETISSRQKIFGRHFFLLLPLFFFTNFFFLTIFFFHNFFFQFFFCLKKISVQDFYIAATDAKTKFKLMKLKDEEARRMKTELNPQLQSLKVAKFLALDAINKNAVASEFGNFFLIF